MFVNRPSLGFDEAEQEQATQEFEISEGKLGEPLELRLVRFQGVQSLHVSSLLHTYQPHCVFVSPSRWAGPPALRADVFFFFSQIFVLSNQGDEEETRIDGIDVFGEAMDVTSRDPLKKVGDDE